MYQDMLLFIGTVVIPGVIKILLFSCDGQVKVDEEGEDVPRLGASRNSMILTL
jgi:hypothetical protein